MSDFRSFRFCTYQVYGHTISIEKNIFERKGVFSKLYLFQRIISEIHEEEEEKEEEVVKHYNTPTEPKTDI